MHFPPLVPYLCLGALVQYDETPSRWKDFATACGAQRQSPIDIITSNVETDETLVNFIFNFSSKNVIKSFKNTGHTVQYMLETDGVEVSGGGLDGTYTPIQFHFHWGGSTDHQLGSEHTIDGNRYPMEMHIVSLKKGLNVTEAAAEEVNMSQPWHYLTEKLPKDDEKYTLNHNISIDELIGGVDLTKFYRYNGSLTTPDCNEAVVWTVFHEPIIVSKELIKLFPERTDISDTYRPTQDLNGRKVLASPALLPNHHWCYDDHCEYSPNLWPSLPDSKCGGQSQSPIIITTDDVQEDSSLNSFTFTNFNDKHAIESIINTGHTVMCVLKADTVEVSGGALGHIYSTLQFHFHWGSRSSDGSEHMVNSKRYPMEIHIVSKRKDLTLEDAIQIADGLAVLGFFIESTETTKGSANSSGFGGTSSLSNSTSDAWNKLTAYLTRIKDINDKANFTDEISIDDLLGIVNRHEYYRYNGSLTTPTCNEAVVWTVFKEPIKVDNNLIMMFPDELKYHDVFRPTQPHNDRKIYSTSASCSPAPVLWPLLLTSLCAFWL
ncbi:carbonic anhydrase-like [Parambassis ranga]|uniref:Carbonic anhydrase n=1 Tax=Parambassis ranga TaxID=210632 RepID=A0A6P7K9M0_9TELE|nr:carbonic anhydrase-like [Parambassis ranga]